MAGVSRRTVFVGSAASWLAPKLAWADAPPVRLSVVVAKTSQLRDVSLNDLRQMYMGRQVSISGRVTVPFNHPPRTPDRVAFDKLVLRMAPDEVARYWVDQRIRGGSPPPRTTDSATLLLRLLARLPDALGYVRQGFESTDLKVLTVDGKAVGDAGYPLLYRP